MEYKIANLDNYEEIISLKNNVKKRIVTENLAIWRDDYPTDEIILDDIKKGYGRIIVINKEIAGFLALMKVSAEYDISIFNYDNLYTFSRIMVKDNFLNQGVGSFLINSVIEEVKNKAKGVGIYADECNIKALKLYQKLGFIFDGFIRLEYGDFIKFVYLYQKDFNYELNQKLLKEASFKKYLFDLKLFKTKYAIVGLKMPFLRDIAKCYDESYFAEVKFINIESLLIASLLLPKLKGDKLLEKVNVLLEYADSWVVTDSIASNLKQVKREPLKYLDFLESLILSNKEFKVRGAIVIMLAQFKDIKLYKYIYNLLDKVNIDTYYVNMAIAWLLTEMSFNDDYVFAYIKKLNNDINKMFNQKRRDSLRNKKNSSL